MQEGSRSVHANAVTLGDLSPARALELRAIDVVGPRQPGRHHGRGGGLCKRVTGAGPCHWKRTTTPAPGLVANGRAFQLTEQWQQVGMAPAGVAGIAPGVEVVRGAAHIDRPVDRAGATDDTPARPTLRPALQAGIGLTGVLPVVRRSAVHPFRGGGHAGAKGGVGTARFQHQDRPVTGCSQATCDGASRGAGADDQVIDDQGIHPADSATASAMPRSIITRGSELGAHPSRRLARSAR